MEFNQTAIERNLRLYGLPGLIAFLGLVGTLVIDPHPSGRPEEMYLAFIAEGAFILSAVALGVGALWMAYNALLEWRWERGDLEGGCFKCSGPMRHLDGRYGPYSKCRMCGAKREGWH